MDNFQAHPCRGNILIVDDTPNNLYLLSSMLEAQGYEVRCANSGAMALMAVKMEQPDLILLDISMPDMNGYEVCECLKGSEQTCGIPIIFLSALSDTIDKVQAFQAGGIDYITKPFQVEEVLVRIENQLSLQRMQKELEQAKVEALKALAQEKELNRLKSEFISMVSHDFRTPLTSIQGFAELLRWNGQLPSLETLNRYIDRINFAVEHLLNLLDEILLMGSIEAGKVQYNPITIDLERFCNDLIETVRFSFGNPHPICFNCFGRDNQAEMDATLLQQILVNLLSNAIKYSVAGTPVHLDLTCQEATVIFQVRDRGIGIPAENQPRLFEAFYRCSNVGDIKGTGLGLTIVKRCVEVHQGTVSLESRPGVGTQVTITLPRHAL